MLLIMPEMVNTELGLFKQKILHTLTLLVFASSHACCSYFLRISLPQWSRDVARNVSTSLGEWFVTSQKRECLLLPDRRC